MRYAIIDGTTVANIIDLEADADPSVFANGLLAIACADDLAGIGWSWSEIEGFVPPELEPEAPPALLPITRRQLRLTLLAHGLLDQVEPAIAALNEPDRSVATIEWQDASEYRRDHPLISQIGMALALSEPTIDAMWVEAMAR